MISLDVQITGETVSDLVFSLEQVIRLVGEEYQSGMDSNDTASFYFARSGEEVSGEDSERED